MTNYQILFWYGVIPVQIRVRDEFDEYAMFRFPAAFQEAAIQASQALGLDCGEDCMTGCTWGDWQSHLAPKDQIAQIIISEFEDMPGITDWQHVVEVVKTKLWR
ncbi:MAG: hypothetical protein HND51_05530 [Chloroflexi bacterium]|nr:hypothetical protein [Chloroflexota bacterium]